MTKTRVNLVMASLMVFGLMTGCGSGSGSGKSSKVSGETYTNKNFSVLVPKGWKSVETVFDGETRQDMVSICKGAKSDIDAFHCPCVGVMYASDASRQSPPPKSFYDDAADIEPFTVGKYDFKGFKGVIMSNPNIVFWTTNAKEYFQFSVVTEVEGKKIALEDAEVQAIIESVKPVEK